jgi:protein-S-isoprenylcysteine O-methyltransferase Ste14
LIVLILAIAVHVYRIRIEEAALMQYFGQKYEAYKKGTWRLVPWIY